MSIVLVYHWCDTPIPIQNGIPIALFGIGFARLGLNADEVTPLFESLGAHGSHIVNNTMTLVKDNDAVDGVSIRELVAVVQVVMKPLISSDEFDTLESGACAMLAVSMYHSSIVLRTVSSDSATMARIYISRATCSPNVAPLQIVGFLVKYSSATFLPYETDNHLRFCLDFPNLVSSIFSPKKYNRPDVVCEESVLCGR